jgi:AraC-like DNA-binding protein
MDSRQPGASCISLQREHFKIYSPSGTLVIFGAIKYFGKNSENIKPLKNNCNFDFTGAQPMKKASIPIHHDELRISGLAIEPISSIAQEVQMAHRDDHYMFIIHQKGSFLWELDFQTILLEGAALSFVAPGQVHRYLKYSDSIGWLLFVDPGFISSSYRETLDLYLNVHQQVPVGQNDITFNLLPVLQSLLADHSQPLNNLLLRSFVDAIAGWLTASIVGAQKTIKTTSRQKHQILNRFKRMIAGQSREIKQVKVYASLLNITPLYLNEVARDLTGFPAGHWIHHELILEAKRLLYYTSLDVKQVAYELGYDDHAYFSRFFKKHTGMTALQFRTVNHDLSNNTY